MEYIKRCTEDGIYLPAFHWPSKENKTCLISIHGILDHFFENYFAEIIGKECNKNNLGFNFGHHRGYGTINDISTNKLDPDGIPLIKKYGTSYDVFEECLYDIQLWIDTAKEFGYEEIFLMAHSMGCNKTIYYLAQNKIENLKGLILVSPNDFAGMAKFDPSYQLLLETAKNNVSNGHPEILLPQPVWGFLPISSGTFLNFFDNENIAKTLPEIENPDKYEFLSKINVPMLAIMGSKDNVIIRSAEDDLKLIKSKATGCSDFSYKVIEGAEHRYMSKGKELADEIVNWIQSIMNKY